MKPSELHGPDRERRFSRFGLIPWAMALLLAYVLSIGPAIHVSGATQSGKLDRALECIYAPLIWLADHWKPAEQVLTPYVLWWFELAERSSNTP